MLKVGVIGCGYWGPNLIRNFTQSQNSVVPICADLSQNRLDHMKGLYPHLEVTTDYKDLLARNDLDAVVVATPPVTHHAITMEALKAGKHVYVEKPLAVDSAQSGEMVARAAELGLTLMAGHTFVFTAAVNKVKEVIESGELGDIFYISTTRVNLGLFQQNINVVWDLAPHDVSILNYILDAMPERVSAVGHSYIRNGVEDVAFLTFGYPNGVLAHVHVSWLDPDKIRRTTVVGSKKMLVYDDISSLEKIRIYDKGVTVQPHYDTFGEFQLAYRFGDIFIPKLDDKEPLKVACQHFMDCVANNEPSRSSGAKGHEVVKVLEAAIGSIKEEGKMIAVDPVESPT
ncbi:MAG: Gfo/Idh/MocA family oxidoreductase [Candidatus Krumholzibacteria bacterium]|nr:Gfo/Idh/MocA family oxidoreductase [Candidatus Krumholzibacteria bacterium]